MMAKDNVVDQVFSSKNFIAIQISRFLSQGGEYQPIWGEWRSITAGVFMYLLMGWGICLLVAFLIGPLLFPTYLSSISPFFNIMLLLFPFILVAVLVLTLTLIRHISISFGTRLNNNDFYSVLTSPETRFDTIAAARLGLAACYGVSPELILPNDTAKSLSRFGFLSHPGWEEFIEEFSKAHPDLDALQALTFEKANETIACNDVKSLIIIVGDL